MTTACLLETSEGHFLVVQHGQIEIKVLLDIEREDSLRETFIKWRRERCRKVSWRPQAGSVAAAILVALYQSDRLTCDELEYSLSRKHTTVSARLHELESAGLVEREPGEQPNNYTLTDAGHRYVTGAE